MPESVPIARQGLEVSALVERVRAQHPGLRVEERSPTAADTGAAAGDQVIVIDGAGAERYVIPLDGTAVYELWRLDDEWSDAGELIGSHRDLVAAVTAAAGAVAARQDPGRGFEGWAAGWQPRPTVPAEIADWSPRVHSLASQALHGGGSLNALGDDPAGRGDRDELRSALEQAADRLSGDLPAGSPRSTAVRQAGAALRADDLDAALHQLTVADERHLEEDPNRVERAAPVAVAEAAGRGQREVAVSNAWRSDLTAAAEVRARVRASRAERPDAAPPAVSLREEEMALLDRFGPAEARAARTGGGRADWTHRRPERAAEAAPGRAVGPVGR